MRHIRIGPDTRTYFRFTIEGDFPVPNWYSCSTGIFLKKEISSKFEYEGARLYDEFLKYVNFHNIFSRHCSITVNPDFNVPERFLYEARYENYTGSFRTIMKLEKIKRT